MNKNPLIPFALIAVFGIGLMFLLGFVGLGNMDEMANPEKKEEVSTNASPEELFKGKCSACHGVDLSGGVGPALSDVGSRLSLDEIKDTIKNGKGIMQPNIISGEDMEKVATWLSEHK